MEVMEELQIDDGYSSIDEDEELEVSFQLQNLTKKVEKFQKNMQHQIDNQEIEEEIPEETAAKRFHPCHCSK